LQVPSHQVAADSGRRRSSLRHPGGGRALCEWAIRTSRTFLVFGAWCRGFAISGQGCRGGQLGG